MPEVQFANLSVRFGDKELLDYASLVTGAFLRDTYVRKYGRSLYHFLNTQIALIDESDPLSVVIWGRLVKETTLLREQYFSAGKIIQDFRSLESAPTSFFVFFLADHRLAFLPETKFAPTLGNLETTVRKFIQAEFSAWSKIVHAQEKNADASYTWKQFYSDHVPPSIALVPLTAAENIKLFMSRFAKIDSLTVHVVKRNQDMNGAELFEALVKKSDQMEAAAAKFVVAGDKESGLNLEATEKFVIETTRTGYERVALKGQDSNGDVLKGSNEDFKLTSTIQVDDKSDFEVVRKLYDLYVSNKNSGVIKVSPRDANQLAPLLEKLVPRKDDQG